MISDKAKHKLLAFHGLDPEKHADGDVDDAIKNALTEDDMDEMTNRAEKAEKELVETKVKGDLEKYANRIGKDEKVVAHWKKALIANRDETVAMLEALPEPEKPTRPAPLHNRAIAETPSPLDKGDAAAQRAATKERALIRNRAEKLEKDGVPSQQAWLRASAEIPAEIAAEVHK